MPDSPFVTAWSPGERFVTARYEDADGIAPYIDIVRAVEVTPTRFAYVDLYVDVILKNDRAISKDEDLLGRLHPDEARSVLAIRDELLRALAASAPPFRPSDPRWDVSAAARGLPPGRELDLISPSG